MRRALVAAFGDPHCHHVLGLCNPETPLESPDNPRIIENPHITTIQRYLWGKYLEYIEKIRIWAGRDPVLLILAGDWMHGMRYPEQLMSNRPSDQTAIAVAIMEPWLKFRDLRSVRMAQGTPAHDPVGSLTLEAFRLFREKHPELDVKATLHALATLNGVDIDYTHVGPHPGSREWLKGNVVRYDLRSMMQSDINYGQEPPRIYLRAHRHEKSHERVEIRGKPDRVGDMFLIPSFCGMSYHAKNATRQYRLTTGMLALEIINGQFIQHRWYDETLDIREKEVFEW